jgi:hypothetical protein
VYQQTSRKGNNTRTPTHIRTNILKLPATNEAAESEAADEQDGDHDDDDDHRRPAERCHKGIPFLGDLGIRKILN